MSNKNQSSNIIVLDLEKISYETIGLAIDYYEAKHETELVQEIERNCIKIEFDTETKKNEFISDLYDYVKRIAVAERTRAVKEIIIGRALYGLIERC